MSGAVIIQQANGEVLDLSAMIQSAVVSTVTELETQKKSQSKRGRSDKGSGSSQLAWILTFHRDYELLTQAELARKAGVHPTTISKIEDGERGISMMTLAKLSVPLGMDFARKVLAYYRRDPDYGYSQHFVAPDTRGTTGGPIQESAVPDEQPDAQETEGGDGAGR